MLTLGDPGYEVWYRFAHGESGLDHPVVSRWARVRALRAAGPQTPDGLATAPLVPERCERASTLLKHGCELLKFGAEELRRRGCALLLTDANGVVMTSFGTDLLSGPPADNVREGGRWDEYLWGTNAIGTSLAENTAVTVIGRAHSDPKAHGLVCYAAPIHDPHGRTRAVIDVTGPVSAADPLLGVTVQSLAAAIEGVFRAHALEDAEQQLRLNETFVASLGHDLRNPLTAVISGADMMLDRPGDPSQRVIAERVRSSSRRMFHMVEQLSDLTRGRLGGGLRLARADGVDLAALTERIVTELRVVHPDRKIDVTVNGDTSGRWDAARLEQVVSNLAGNGIRHGVPSVPIRVDINGTWRDRVFLKVTNGGEIDNSVVPHLFEPFHASKKVRTREGLGLGLYIVEQIVRAHQGAIEVVTTRGATTFSVSLPRHV